MYRIVYKTSAAKALVRMPSHIAQRFVRAFEALATDPRTERLDISKLQGREGFRLRIGGRALYRIDKTQLIVEVMRIDTRGEVYK